MLQQPRCRRGVKRRLHGAMDPSGAAEGNGGGNSSSSSSSTSNSVLEADIPGAAGSVREELRRTALELEPVTAKDQIVGYQLTYRAVLARKGYLVRNTLGSGSYSKVKRALSLKTASVHLVAVKIIDCSRAPHDYQERFMPRELKLWPRLHHPHLTKLIDWFQDSRRVYMVLEYADGGDALRYVQQRGALSDSTARRWTAQLAGAVAYMHDMRIAHRDLKLENILLDWNGSVKLCDFGFVREFAASGSEALSETYCGSKSYASPEILTGVPYDPRASDVWALGVIVYILVTGKMPFDETKGTKSILEEQRLLDLHGVKGGSAASDECVALIRRMFTWEFASRPTIHSVIADDWLMQSPVSSIRDTSLSGFRSASVINTVIDKALNGNGAAPPASGAAKSAAAPASPPEKVPPSNVKTPPK